MTARRALMAALAGATLIGTALAGPGLVSADPAPVLPTTAPPTTPVAVPPVDPAAVPPVDPAAVPPVDPAAAPPVTPPRVPPIPNAQYGSGESGGGVFGTLKDLWHQVQNPAYAQDELMGGGAATPPPGAGPAPALPPGYVSINAPGSETASTAGNGRGAATGRPALPPGYYSTDGPPPPGYQFGSAAGALPALPAPAPVAPTTLPPVPSQ